MNDLLSGSFKTSVADGSSPPHSHNIEMSKAKVSGGSCHGGNNLDTFFLDVEVVNEDLKELDRLCHNLRSSNEQSKTLHNANAVKELKKKMDADVTAALKTARRLKGNLEALDRANEVNRSLPESGPGSSSDRQRTSVVNGLRKKLKDEMEKFSRVRETITNEYKETVGRMCFTVTGEYPDEATLERLISTGESETFLQKAIQEQGRGRILDTINEIQERHDAVKDIEKSLNELHQVFLDMAVLVEHQGAQLDDIEGNVKRANSLVRSGADRLVKARFYQKNTRKWTCFAILLLLIIVVLIVVFTVKPWESNGGGGGGAPRQATPVQAQPPPPPAVNRRLLR
ncbi:Syntaxin-122 [Arabidopsis thaliana]|jgi:syntaxin 1B/2/3|uniref:Syntaxin-122 n=4 Tax=Arabidopsis TaxID=3701 RepID=SY122_ARATH|nr:syntaxin of plants 122 [Arabidopsis thaliana]Q9SVC2.1 RecName: Full=Syntaxin-122; Short=AtSYP122; AltName: Full=Synt4 [Arabidopsis thaliana]KAG7628236.1 Target SNARE coiled-coil homology domain [Arabidopsis thaliana x Arabidopsis arenosa]KAG7634148.1 Target SNARE coiled-coil homology domain [Arabidopsis suecica]AAK93584.1 putative syntaxin protein synt4 [Arabidopsis thaliana]AAM14349.1 putative syntaxin synt4 protein [Arabidopsis thaliana]AAN60366.1 unknown [Arabidopsis thaliana]|eukprot:NP_190808.1 syntaxin of plants 122 [Arabidopsis thaliana]